MADYINKIRTTEGDKPVNYEALANKPNSLPNPNKIKFTGSVVTEYDGSSEVTVNIPNGASEEQAAQIQTNTNDISELKNKTSELKSDFADLVVYSENLSETVEWHSGYFVADGNGQVYSNADYAYSDYIAVDPNTQYYCSGTVQSAWYDRGKNFIIGYASSDAFNPEETVAVSPSGCAFIRITWKQSADKPVFCAGDSAESLGITGLNPKWGYVKRKDLSVLHNKTITFIGDSIVWGIKGGGSYGERVSTPFPQIIQDRTGCISTNLGISGSTIAGDGVSTNAVTSGVMGYQPVNTRFGEIDTKTDYIIIMAMTNDYGGNEIVPVGSQEDADNLTFCGALKTIFENYYSNYHSAKIGVIIEPHRANESENALGHTYADYVNAMKNMCELYSIPYLDLYSRGECFPSNATWKSIYMPDGLHPTQELYGRLAYKIEKFIETL